MVRLPPGGGDRLRERAAAAGEKVADYVREAIGETGQLDYHEIAGILSHVQEADRMHALDDWLREKASPSPSESDPTCPSERQSS